MKKKKNKIRYVVGLTIFLILLCLGNGSVWAGTTNSIPIKVNDSLKGSLVNKDGSWYIVCKKLEASGKKADKRIAKITVKKKSSFVSGYYYYAKTGKVDERKKFHTLDTKIGDIKFKGLYYFGYENGRLYQNRGWTVIRGKKYYLSITGRVYRNCWKQGYYLNDSGEIVTNGKTPDGYYVDCDGRKCNKEEVKLSSLKKTLNATISNLGGSAWSVYIKNLKTGDCLSINETPFYPASTIKLFAMEGIYDGIKKGTITRTSRVNSLLNNMITVSDNESFNQLIKILGNGSFVTGCANLNRYLVKQGYKNTACHSTLHPALSARISDGGRNSATAKDTGLLLEKIYKGTCVSKAYSKEMENLLLAQKRRFKIPAGLPSGVKCGNKTGETASYQHDAAIVYGSKTDYVVCIYSQSSAWTGISGIKKLSAQIYSALN